MKKYQKMLEYESKKQDLINTIHDPEELAKKIRELIKELKI